MANKNVNDSKIKTHILTKKVQLIVDTDRFDTDEEKKAEAIAAGKFPIGVLYENNDVMEYTKAYDQIIQRAQEGK